MTTVMMFTSKLLQVASASSMVGCPLHPVLASSSTVSGSSLNGQKEQSIFMVLQSTTNSRDLFTNGGQIDVVVGMTKDMDNYEPSGRHVRQKRLSHWLITTIHLSSTLQLFVSLGKSQQISVKFFGNHHYNGLLRVCLKVSISDLCKKEISA